MKLYKKSECTFKKGMIIGPDNETLCLPDAVARQLDALDEAFQLWRYLAMQPAFHEPPTSEGFKRKLQRDVDRQWKKAKTDTPLVDQAVKESLQFAKELEAIELTDSINLAYEKYADLLDFCADDEFAAHYGAGHINCVSLGNPLLLTTDKVMDTIDLVVKFSKGTTDD